MNKSRANRQDEFLPRQSNASTLSYEILYKIHRHSNRWNPFLQTFNIRIPSANSPTPSSETIKFFFFCLKNKRLKQVVHNESQKRVIIFAKKWVFYQKKIFGCTQHLSCQREGGEVEFPKYACPTHKFHTT